MLDAGQNIITRNLPKTGQTELYAAGDDGDVEAGWWRGRLDANNRTRFVQQTIVGDDVVLDRATGLMWPEDFRLVGGYMGVTLTWANAIAWANALNFAGFTDWRLPNVIELISIARFRAPATYIWDPFIIGAYYNYHTSTTVSWNPTLNFFVQFICPNFQPVIKTQALNVVAVRKGV